MLKNMNDTWDYRVVRQTKDGNKWLAIQEVYYDDETGEPMAHTMDLEVVGDNIASLRKQLQSMLWCLDKDIVDESYITSMSGEKVKPGETDGLEVGPWEGMVHTDENIETYIYESPDGGKTLYRRKIDHDKKEKINTTRYY